ncbi:MAG: amino acid ABC transporter ATP-binding protein [Eubacteriales bacterium]|nr:amino acid ABC transporter ATP-binding protein [Eubacteriales bacterium]
MEMLRVTDVKKGFDGLDVLKGVSFTLQKGEVLSIIGRSGSGKSTLLRCLLHLEQVDNGSIFICGEPLVENGQYVSPAQIKERELHMGMVFQSFHLFPHLSVLQNVMEAPILVRKEKKNVVEQRALALLAKLGLADKAAAYPCQLSGGQAQRVSIARALAMEPDILCFDEPTSALDPELTGEVLNVIRSLAKEDMTMIVVTHEMAFARDLADTVIFMDGGVIVDAGTPDEVLVNTTNERTKQFLSRYHEEG